MVKILSCLVGFSRSCCIVMAFNLLKSTKGKDILAYNGQQYMTKRLNQCGTVTWRCMYLNKYRCNSTMVTRGNEVITEPGNHSHQADVIQLKKYILLSEVREIAKAGESTTRNIIASVVQLWSRQMMFWRGYRKNVHWKGKFNVRGEVWMPW